MRTDRLTRLALLAALCIALRFAFGSLPNIKPITAIFLVVAGTWGLVDAGLVMGLTMTLTALIFGFGPWVVWQVLAYLVVLVIWRFGALPLTNALKSATITWQAQALLAGLMGVIYGLVIDSLGAVFYSLPVWIYLLNGLGFNLAHALSTALFYPLITTIFTRLGSLSRKENP